MKGYPNTTNLKESRMGGSRLDLYGLGYGQVAGCFENSIQAVGFIKCGEFIAFLSNCMGAHSFFKNY
jgi:hypothetical protein